MRTEVHVHGSLYLRKGVTLAQIESGLRKWLDYLDAENFAELRSLEEEEPGVVFDRAERVLDICWTGEVGRNFRLRLQEAFYEIAPLLERSAGVELTYYHEDGRDEVQLLFAGPTPEAVHQAQRQRMVEDVSGLLSRHFEPTTYAPVVALLNQLFDQDWAQRDTQREHDFSPSGSLVHFRKKHLH